MNKKDYAVFILSHGRARDIKTVKTLKKFGYTGEWFVVIDDLDKQRHLYETKFDKNRLIVFDKKKVAEQTDTGDCSESKYNDLPSILSVQSYFPVHVDIHCGYWI